MGIVLGSEYGLEFLFDDDLDLSAWPDYEPRAPEASSEELLKTSSMNDGRTYLEVS